MIYETSDERSLRKKRVTSGHRKLMKKQATSGRGTGGKKRKELDYIPLMRYGIGTLRDVA